MREDSGRQVMSRLCEIIGVCVCVECRWLVGSNLLKEMYLYSHRGAVKPRSPSR